ncbi:MAG TPA: hypothetical protein PLQ67_01410, partial [Burkholderiaceae bacterium]|nr:hypothetical protein [Burkholderiaceae bacterium]
MQSNAHITDAQWEQVSARRFVRTLARGLLYPLALALALQPAVYAAPSPSLLSQLPAFTQSSAASNVIFLMDDSTSMLSMQLPIPPGITPAAGNPWPFKLNRASPHTGNTHFSPDVSLSTNYPYTREDWILRSPTLNPAYYNPAIRYLPWNNDGVRMPHSGTSVVHEASAYRRGSSGHDPRYKGPNYTSSTSSTLTKNQDNFTGGYGANARYLDASRTVVSSSTAGAAFRGPVPSAYNQDIFTQPMTRTSSSCSVWDTTQIINNYDAPPYCSSGETAPISEYSKVDCATGSAIGSWSTTPEDTTCPAANEVGYVIKPPEKRFTCPSGTVDFGPSWSPSCCPSGNIIDPAPANVTCTVSASGANACTICTSGTAVSHCPTGLTCPVANRWVIQPTLPVIAHYFRYQGSNDAASKGDPANYTMVEIERYDNHDADPATALIPSTQLFPIYTTDGDAVLPGNTTIRPDCTATQSGVKACTWAEEAQNFANWYTYYRTRLFSAIAVTAEALSGLTAANGGLDTLRLGYGALNYFNGSRDPYASPAANDPWLFDPATAPTRTVADVDPPGSSAGHVPNEGTITRGVRPFAQGSAARKQVFEWLFSLRTQGATPTREALDSVGRYFSRKDAWGPWSAYPGAVPIQDTRPVTEHESCRRSYTILVSDGEWTNTAGGVQPLLESRGAPPSWVSAQAATTPLTAASDLTVPVFNDGTHKDAAGAYKEFPPPAGVAGHLQPQFNTVAGSPTGTLSDVAYYWWSRDLRPDLINGVRPEVDPAKPEKRNESFWQNVTPYIVGYGLHATMDTSTPLPTTRTSIMNRTSVSWPTVDTTAGKIQDADCSNLDVNGAQSGCGRV